MRSLGARVVLSIFCFLVYSLNFVSYAQTLAAGKVAGMQFENSDTAYVVSNSLIDLVTHGNAPLYLLVAALVIIWFAPLCRLFKGKNTKLVVAGLGLCGITYAGNAYAYYDKTDWNETYMILPNQSAFYIPDMGANKDSQSSFGSEAYYRDNKIAAKRFTVPHSKLENSGTFSNYYVPAGRLILVDRTPYQREWVKTDTRGTSAGDQSFPCQSTEGLNITAGIAIGTSVLEENAPKFLYRFGVKTPEGDLKDPNVIFSSVFYSRSLAEVMDTVVRSKIQSLVCSEIGSRTFDKANLESTQIMDTVQKRVTEYLNGVGITLDFIGWADTFGFDADIQKAVNDRYVAEKINPVLPTLQTLADLRVKEGLGDGLRNHGLPSNLIALPTNMLEWFKSAVGGGTTTK
jgi:hypothetical protein